MNGKARRVTPYGPSRTLLSIDASGAVAALWVLSHPASVSLFSDNDSVLAPHVPVGVRRGGDRWSPFVDAALGHVLRFISAEGDRRMPASHYDGRLEGEHVVFPQVGAPPTSSSPSSSIRSGMSTK
jgi:hypothetical protein